MTNEQHTIPEATEIRIVEETRNGAVTTRRVITRDRIRSATAPHLTGYTEWTELCVLSAGDELMIDVKRRSAAMGDDVEIRASTPVFLAVDERLLSPRLTVPLPSPRPSL